MLCRRGFADDRSDFRGSGIFRGLFVLGMAGGRADETWGKQVEQAAAFRLAKAA